MQFASIGARRRNADPTPYLDADGARHASGFGDLADPASWSTDGGALHLASTGRTYSPRPELTPAPTNPANPILDASRDNAGDSDVWGWAMGWAFAACAVLEYVGRPVPAEYGYRSSAWGAAHDLADGTWESAETVSVLGLGTVGDDPDGPEVTLTDPDDIPAETWEAAGDYAEHAARVLNRYLEAARTAGLDY